jgi:hypothetical protein
MTLLDRIIAGSLALGIWVWIFMSVLSPVSLHALSVDASDVTRLRSFVKKVVEEHCTVYGFSISCQNPEQTPS